MQTACSLKARQEAPVFLQQGAYEGDGGSQMGLASLESRDCLGILKLWSCKGTLVLFPGSCPGLEF